jgi:hypothetical protein
LDRVAANADARHDDESMKLFVRLAAVLVLWMWATSARGDGGTMLLHQDAGPFTITLFAAPQPLQVGAADLSVMVQDRNSGEVLLDSAIDLRVAPEAERALQQTVRLSRGQASNRLLQAATVHFSRAGKWRVMLLVRRGNDVASLSTECVVEPNSSRAVLVWFYILLPAGIILLFVVHQGLKLRQKKTIA